MTLRGCVKCDAPFSPSELLARLTGYDGKTDSGVSTCHACGETIELRIRPGHLELGFTYWAGSMHFEGMVTVPAPGLKRVKGPNGESCLFAGCSYRLSDGKPPDRR